MTAIALLFGLTSVSFAIPQQLTQQGRLMDSSGAAIDGQHNLSFRIFDSGSGSNVLWEETITVLFNNGYYTALLGSDVASNPLEDSVLMQEPLYLEVEVDNNGPLTPRQGIKSTPFARMAGSAESIDGGTVNASEISVGGTIVVDSAGSWVGPTIGMNWGDISGIPADLADGDDDSLASITCSPGQILGWNGSSWACTADNGLTEAEVEAFVTNDPINLSVGSQVGGLDILTTADQGESLADLSCQDGELPKYDTLLGWQCGIDNDTTDWNAIQNMPVDFADGIDNDTSDWNALQNIPNDFADGIDNNTQLTESQVEGFITNGIGAYDLDSATTIGGATIMSAQNCSAGEILSFDGAQWNCTNFSTLLDADQDGVLAWDDCDDSDPAQLSNSYDQDCDGTISSADCNDFDPNSTIVADDADCDDVLTANDCDDSDDSLLAIANDADCDGYITVNDCDDGDPNISPGTVEICGDGIDNDCDGISLDCFAGTFTNCGNTGATGPTQSQCSVEYLGTMIEGQVTLSNGIQQWTVPTTGSYRIEAIGAAGGSTQNGNGKGAEMIGNFSLTQGDVLHILVGQKGGDSTSGTCDSSGGGGTFVALNGLPLIVAGGGGGGSHSSSGHNATLTDTAHSGCGTAGTGGNGGSGSGCPQSYAGGGGGFYTDGSNVGWGSNEAGGSAFLNGGEGAPAVYTGSPNAGRGGFGGGSTGHGNCYIGGGAGGGYSGGGPGGDHNGGVGGGGGGSFNDGTLQNNTAGIGTGHGSVTISAL